MLLIAFLLYLNYIKSHFLFKNTHFKLLLHTEINESAGFGHLSVRNLPTRKPITKIKFVSIYVIQKILSRNIIPLLPLSYYGKHSEHPHHLQTSQATFRWKHVVLLSHLLYHSEYVQTLHFLSQSHFPQDTFVYY